jgi:hypothetical protein
MKKLIVFIILLISIFSLCYSQERNSEDDFNHSIQINPLLLPLELLLNAFYALKYDNITDQYILGTNIEYQYALNNYFVVCLIPTFLVNGRIWYEDKYGNKSFYDILTYNLHAGLSFHPFGTKLKGWFIGVDSILGMQHITTDVTDNLFNIGIMTKVGHQWIRPNGFTISYWLGFGNVWDIPFDGNKYEWKSANPFDLPFVIGGNFSIGYSF